MTALMSSTDRSVSPLAANSRINRMTAPARWVWATAWVMYSRTLAGIRPPLSSISAALASTNPDTAESGWVSSCASAEPISPTALARATCISSDCSSSMRSRARSASVRS